MINNYKLRGILFIMRSRLHLSYYGVYGTQENYQAGEDLEVQEIGKQDKKVRKTMDNLTKYLIEKGYGKVVVNVEAL